MKFFLTKFKGLRCGWGKRALDEDVFYRLCRRFKIKVIFYNQSNNGFHYRCKSKDYIVIDPRLTERERVFTMFHELGHYLMHAPAYGASANFSGLIKDSATEREANAFALSCVFPLKLLTGKSMAELMSEEGYSRGAIDKRREVYEQYGI